MYYLPLLLYGPPVLLNNNNQFPLSLSCQPLKAKTKHRLKHPHRIDNLHNVIALGDSGATI